MPPDERLPRSSIDIILVHSKAGHKTVDNAVLAHRLCNKLDHFIRNGLSIEKDLTRVRKAREDAIARNNERP